MAIQGNNNASKLDMDIVHEICERVSNGENIIDILKSNEKYPSFQTWCNWKRNNNAVFELYVNSVQDKSDVELKEMDDIQKELKLGKLTPAQANVLIQTIKWKLAKFYPKMYGDRIDHTISDKSMSPTIVTTLSETELKKRLQK